MTRILLLTTAASIAALSLGLLAGLAAALSFTLFTGGAMIVGPEVFALAVVGAFAGLFASVLVLLEFLPKRDGEEAFGELIRAEFGPHAWRPR